MSLSDATKSDGLLFASKLAVSSGDLEIVAVCFLAGFVVVLGGLAPRLLFNSANNSASWISSSSILLDLN